MRYTHIVCSIFIAILFTNCHRLPQQPFVEVSLLGYNSDDTKQALLVNADATGFGIIDPVTSELVYEGSITKPASPDPLTENRATVGFSDFGSKGYFKLKLEESHNGTPDLFVGRSNKRLHLQGQGLAKFHGNNYEDSEKNYFVNGVANQPDGDIYIRLPVLSSANEVIITAGN
jgi:hypothetical protein